MSNRIARHKLTVYKKRFECQFDENLSWNIQINELTKKIASGIGALKRVRSFVPVETLQLIFNSLVQPYFNYCCTVWDNWNKTLPEKLQKLQNRAARVVTFSSYDTNADVLIEKLGQKKIIIPAPVSKSCHGL